MKKLKKDTGKGKVIIMDVVLYNKSRFMPGVGCKGDDSPMKFLPNNFILCSLHVLF
jgi:hypothetical protein